VEGQHHHLTGDITMRKKNFTLFVIHCSFFLAFLSGCGEKLPDGMPKLYPLTITVMQDGNPLADAEVSLFSAEGESTWSIGGTTGKQGRVAPFTHGRYSGVPAGKYKVCIFKVETVSNRKDGEQDDKRRVIPDEYDVVDTKLKNPAMTTLTLEVKQGKNDITLDTGKAIRKKINTGGA
jgi:hypothetical protein